ncbi:hypothetical protein [Mesorhizobium sp. B1-1-8]|uniref:hypothetical protein n=1 Tax=Mesorhizobium sp. B1-1-8 TaxID=2589976 RepID=UPI00112D83CC|nr:hypothetical protein [Mesorhizobium sp. B1-1-8]UCI07388.1 hypothetical protein FJ974_26995 [Mesorhizobium sp. B1-1-8]
MPIYRVEQMQGDEVLAAQTVDAPTPSEAATGMSGKDVTLGRWEENWFRVIDENWGKVFAYSFASDQPAAGNSQKTD